VGRLEKTTPVAKKIAAEAITRVGIRGSLVDFDATISILDPAQHLAGSFCGLRTWDSVDAHHQEKSRIVGGHERNGKSVSWSVPQVNAGGGSGLHQRIAILQRAIHLRARSASRRTGHAVKNQLHSGMPSFANQFEIRTRHAQRRDVPARSETCKLSTGCFVIWNLESIAGCGLLNISRSEVGGQHAEI